MAREKEGGRGTDGRGGSDMIPRACDEPARPAGPRPLKVWRLQACRRRRPRLPAVAMGSRSALAAQREGGGRIEALGEWVGAAARWGRGGRGGALWEGGGNGGV